MPSFIVFVPKPLFAAAVVILIACLVIGLYLFSILPRTSRKKEMGQYQNIKFAHRGYHSSSHLIPENSIAAFKAAARLHYGIELDVHLTKDGQVAVFHDDTLDRLCGVTGRIESYTYSELQQFFLLHTSEKIPLLSEVLSFIDGRVPLLIELKIPGRSVRICEKTYEILKTYNGPFLIQSFNTMGLHWFRLHAPHILRGQLSSNLTASPTREPYILKFMAKHLLFNFLGRPDFISYKLKDLPEISVWICRRVFQTPVAVWTLRTEKARTLGSLHYDMQIFEKEAEFY